MTKLSALLEQIIDKATTRLTNFTWSLKDIVEEDGNYTYQDVKLLNFNVSNGSFKKSFSDIINDLTVINLWKMTSADIKGIITTRNKRSGGCILQIFIRSTSKTCKIQWKKGMYFSFDFGWCSTHIDFVG